MWYIVIIFVLGEGRVLKGILGCSVEDSVKMQPHIALQSCCCPGWILPNSQGCLWSLVVWMDLCSVCCWNLKCFVQVKEEAIRNSILFCLRPNKLPEECCLCFLKMHGIRWWVLLIVTESMHKNMLGRIPRTGSLLRASLSLSGKRTEMNMGVGLLSWCNSQLQVPQHDISYRCYTGCLLFAPSLLWVVNKFCCL